VYPIRVPVRDGPGGDIEQRRFGDSALFYSAVGFGSCEMSITQYGTIDVGEASMAMGAAGGSPARSSSQRCAGCVPKCWAVREQHVPGGTPGT
jgi:hypothetical protein